VTQSVLSRKIGQQSVTMEFHITSLMMEVEVVFEVLDFYPQLA
jgi:hypothetical protein